MSKQSKPDTITTGEQAMESKPVRKAMSKKTRFEVFKRDTFTCQYCGAKAPEAVLHVDHINPVANGGDNSIMNLVTACAACNGGKGARKLDDRSTVEKQRAQVEELQARREQLEMMLQWRDTEQTSAIDAVDAICERIGERGGFLPNESGKQHVRRWLKRFTVTEILTAMDESFDHYMKFDGDEPNKDAWELAFKKLPAIASLRRQAEENPHAVRLAYIQGILRRRLHDPRGNYFSALETVVAESGLSVERIEQIAKTCDDWDHFCDTVWSSPTAGTATSAPPIVSDPFEAYFQSEAKEAARRQQAEEDRELTSAYDDDGFDNDGCDD